MAGFGRNNKSSVRLVRREAVGMDELVEEYIREMKLTSGLNRQRVFAAWDKVSGVGDRTVSRYLRGRVLYVGLSSSALRQQLYCQRAALLEKVNAVLKEDGLYTKDDNKTDKYLKNIVLQ